jgi:hypothetical protein
MAILETFTTVGPMSVCYPRLSTTLLPADIQVDDKCPSLDNQGLDLVNKAEGLGLGSTVRFLPVK